MLDYVSERMAEWEKQTFFQRYLNKKCNVLLLTYNVLFSRNVVLLHNTANDTIALIVLVFGGGVCPSAL